MTLDEAIKHCEEVVKDYEKIKCIKAITLEELKYEVEYRQVAEWLKELKQLRELTSEKMTNKEKFIEVFGEEPQRQYATKSWWDQEYAAPESEEES